MNSEWLLLNGKELYDIRVSETCINSYLGHNHAQHLSLSVLRYFDCFHGNVEPCPMFSSYSSERSLSQCMCCIDVQLLHQNLRYRDAGTFDLVDTCTCLSCLVLWYRDASTFDLVDTCRCFSCLVLFRMIPIV